DVEIGLCPICKRFKEMIKHFRWNLAYHFPFKLCFPYQPVSSAKINSGLCQTVIHGQTETVSFNSQFMAQGFMEYFSQGYGRILNGMVLIHFQISLNLDFQVHLAMSRQLIQHMVKEVQSGTDITFARPVQIQLYKNIGFIGFAYYFRYPILQL